MGFEEVKWEENAQDSTTDGACTLTSELSGHSTRSDCDDSPPA